jgi:replication-associated recombination protein RarA
MSDLFSQSETVNRAAPLAERMRPESLDDFVGQQHLVGKGRILRRLVEAEEMTSMILWGPPGTGKTTLARLVAKSAEAEFISFSAVLAGVKEVRAVIDRARENAKYARLRTVLFVDEIHRFNKAQQDAFLPHVERGLFFLIGATTENPSFEIISPLLSRTRVLVLKPLETEDLNMILTRALTDTEQGLGQKKIDLAPEARKFLLETADGDARVLLNALELAAAAARFDTETYRVGLEEAEEAVQKKSYRLLGSPEGDLALAQLAIYLATAEKSNAVYMAYKASLADAREKGSLPVPLHIRNAPTGLMKDLDYGQGYQYAHDHEGAVVAQDHLPEQLKGVRYYLPTDRGREKAIAERMAHLRERIKELDKKK